jgi:hypothetical protein
VCAHHRADAYLQERDNVHVHQPQQDAHDKLCREAPFRLSSIGVATRARCDILRRLRVATRDHQHVAQCVLGLERKLDAARFYLCSLLYRCVGTLSFLSAAGTRSVFRNWKHAVATSPG